MLEELTAGRMSGLSVLTSLLTPVVRTGGKRLLAWEPQGSVLIEMPTGSRLRFGRAGTHKEPVLTLKNYSAITQSIRRGSLGFAEAYLDGHIDCSDLQALFAFFLRNRQSLEASSRGLFKVRVGDRLAHRARRNTRRGSQRNISDHYDLGNDFYRLWLDETLVYSSAYYGSGAVSLEDAQAAKFDLIHDVLEITPGDEILEIGCGWGAFARATAARTSAKVTGITLSREQLAFARGLTRRQGLSDVCRFRFQDYRDVTGSFDHIVSIEMIEAVGEENWPTFFQSIHDRLNPGGTAIIQAITMDEAAFERYRRKTDFIQRYIFPGGMLPTVEIMHRQAAEAGLACENVRSFGNCYARTLQEWDDRFDASWSRIAEMGFDERFRRKWQYYLAYCEAGFLNGIIDVGLFRLTKPS